MSSKKIGISIRELRKSKGITATFIAQHIGVSPSLFWKIERDLVRLKAEQLESISKILGVDMSYFFDVKVDKNAISNEVFEHETA